MRLQYELKFIDYFCFNAVHQFLLVTVQAMYLGSAIALFIAFQDMGPLVALVVALVAYLALWAIQLLANIFMLYSRKNKALLTTHIVEIQDDAFYEENPYGKSYCYWPGIAKTVGRPGFVAVYISAHFAHIIPSRAFVSKHQRNEFLTLMRRKQNAV